MHLLFYSILIFLLVVWVERPGSFFSNTLIIRKNPGEELEDWLKKFHWQHNKELSLPGLLPRYKFYSEVTEILLKLARKMGGNYQESLLFLREGLQLDRQFEKKIKEAILGMWFQMGFMMLLTWAFIIGALNLVEVNLEPIKLVLIFIWQILGLICLPFLSSLLRKKYFADIGKLWKILFILKALVKVPLSRTEVFSLAGLGDLAGIKQKSLLSLVTKLRETCQKCLKLGTSYEEEVTYLMEELRFQEKWHFELFEKKLTVIKLGLLSLFFLPSYLAFIFLLLGDLITLM